MSKSKFEKDIKKKEKKLDKDFDKLVLKYNLKEMEHSVKYFKNKE